ncbi:UPF0545 protein C22orf39 homolog [Pararge aegeria]|uniref:Synaptic plasticity regulator PANTS n=2 Tax=Pararge aegeria TaxID=116150 RepID=A0A8S4RU76_9NEOP|nr:UPF0545 protein C22orf39 homolog [Pararge aegeria]CAH2241168.1 jg3234 [Pararge aegeria aegeria]
MSEDSKHPEESNETSKMSKLNEATSSTDEQPQSDEPEDKWMIRDCEMYKDEYKECTSFRARFHQYFIYGETLDCNQWKKDYNNCCKWTDDGDLKAADAVIKSERIRRLERLKSHYQNDIWTKREAPPSDWDKPLPDWMVKRDENSYLAYKAKEIKEGKEEDSVGSFCSIM